MPRVSKILFLFLATIVTMGLIGTSFDVAAQDKKDKKDAKKEDKKDVKKEEKKEEKKEPFKPDPAQQCQSSRMSAARSSPWRDLSRRAAMGSTPRRAAIADCWSPFISRSAEARHRRFRG